MGGIIGMVGGFRLECWAPSRQNGGRHQIGIGGRLTSESAVWEYIRKNNLQNPANKREIVADEALKKIFGKDKATMFEMNKFFSQHLT